MSLREYTFPIIGTFSHEFANLNTTITNPSRSERDIMDQTLRGETIRGKKKLTIDLSVT